MPAPSTWRHCAGLEGSSVRNVQWAGEHDAAEPLALCKLPLRNVGHGWNLFQDSHLTLTVWFRAMWQVASQKNGISALGLQRALGLGSYKTVWAMLHKLRRAMVRTGRDRLEGVVAVDEAIGAGRKKALSNVGRSTRP